MNGLNSEMLISPMGGCGISTVSLFYSLIKKKEDYDKKIKSGFQRFSQLSNGISHIQNLLEIKKKDEKCI